MQSQTNVNNKCNKHLLKTEVIFEAKTVSMVQRSKETLIDRDMSVTELCGEVGMCRNYVTTTINGRMYAPALAEKISKALDIDTEYTI